MSIAETHADLVRRARRLLADQSPETYRDASGLPVHIQTFRRFLFGGPLQVETLRKIESWLENKERQALGQQEAQAPHA